MKCFKTLILLYPKGKSESLKKTRKLIVLSYIKHQTDEVQDRFDHTFLQHV